jgi:hypothetical protein
VIDITTTFRESTAQTTVASVPLSHVSIELGHLYAEDFDRHLNDYFDRVSEYLTAARADCVKQLPPGVKPRISTCFLIDDYFNRFGEPEKVIHVLVETAARNGMSIDYIARESGCAVADGNPVAQLALGRIVDDPPQGTTGARPLAVQTGWLCNGERSPTAGPPGAMRNIQAWQPPVENGPNMHAVFTDVQLFSELDGVRTWSCAFLASVWQLIRLGLLRYLGEPAVRPTLLDIDGPIAADWSHLPAIMQINPDATPFCAYRTMSILHSPLLPIEHAVGVILRQVSVDPAVLEQVMSRSHREGIDLPADLTHRLGYGLLSR